MEFGIASVLFVTIVMLTFVNFLIHNSRKGKLIDKIPGPLGLPIIGNVFDFAIPLGDLWKLLRKLSRKYYTTYKVWIGHWALVIIQHPDDIEILLSSQKNITKSFLYDFLHPWLNDGLLTSTGSKWRHRRKTLTPAFHFKLLQDFVAVFVENSERMVKSLKKESGEVVKDVVPMLAKYTLNVICETSMGTSLQDNDPKQERYRVAVKKLGEFMFHRGPRPWLKSDWIFSLTKMGRQHAEELKILHGFTTEIIQKRKHFHEETGGKYLQNLSPEFGNEPESNIPDYDMPLKKKRLAMLDLLIAVQKEQGVIDDQGIREEVDTFIFEGHDTTNTTMSFAVLLLAENKEIQARARAEIDEVLQQSDGRLGIVELQKLTYLDRCIKEALRLYPAVPVVARKLTEDLHLKKFVVSSETSAVVMIYDVHRDPNFWPNPEVFDPDRFLPERIEGRHPFSYIPFSAGPRNCIGQKFAMLELKTFIGSLLHNFYLEPMIMTSAVHMLPDLVLKSQEPLQVKFIPVR